MKGPKRKQVHGINLLMRKPERAGMGWGKKNLLYWEERSVKDPERWRRQRQPESEALGVRGMRGPGEINGPRDKVKKNPDRGRSGGDWEPREKTLRRWGFSAKSGLSRGLQGEEPE